MASEYSQAEWDALEEKQEHPDRTVCCPRCGSKLVYESGISSCEVRCLTEGCIKETIRGL